MPSDKIVILAGGSMCRIVTPNMLNVHLYLPGVAITIKVNKSVID